ADFPPTQMPAFAREIHYVVTVVGIPAGEAVPLTVRFVSPEGEVRDIGQGEFPSKGERNPVRLNVALTITFRLEGTYWFEAYVRDRLMARTPLHVVFAPEAPQAPLG